MIAYDFEYHRPDTLAEAADTFADLTRRGKRPLYYGGGTEIITQARLGQISTGGVIDLKAIPECRVLQANGTVRIGAALTLAEVSEANLWPLLTDAGDRVADHTARCKITLGGNLAGRIQYREAALALLLVESTAVVAGPGGQVRSVPFAQVFEKQLRLKEGEFLVRVEVDGQDARLAHICIKKTRLDWIDYPLVTVAAIRKGGSIRTAFSGLCAFPFRSRAVEEALNGDGSPETRVHNALERLPAPAVADLHGSAGYRRFVAAQTLGSIMTELGE